MPNASSMVMPVATPAAKLMISSRSKKRVSRYQWSSSVRIQSSSPMNSIAASPMVSGGYRMCRVVIQPKSRRDSSTEREFSVTSITLQERLAAVAMAAGARSV